MRERRVKRIGQTTEKKALQVRGPAPPKVAMPRRVASRPASAAARAGRSRSASAAAAPPAGRRPPERAAPLPCGQVAGRHSIESCHCPAGVAEPALAKRAAATPAQEQLVRGIVVVEPCWQPQVWLQAGLVPVVVALALVEHSHGWLCYWRPAQTLHPQSPPSHSELLLSQLQEQQMAVRADAVEILGVCFPTQPTLHRCRSPSWR
mmetsp:Transcript_57057/g.104840  ORF Transcript_57057/g.104840 Transcript_57057/m.104840 type:complete len:206 (+) Transcript_57057:1016-1633(+)